MEIKSSIKSPLFDLLTQIEVAANHGLDLIALGMVVALPDICASLISDDGRTNCDRYKDWCAQNLTAGFEWVKPEDIYSMRCGVLHNGRFGDLAHDIEKVIFVPKGGATFSDCKANDAYIYSVHTFCMGINRAVVRWYEANQDHPNIRVNIGRLMQYRIGGVCEFPAATVIA
jgi:hypothetical protein